MTEEHHASLGIIVAWHHTITSSIPSTEILNGLTNLLVSKLHSGHEIDRCLNHVGALANQITTLLRGLTMLF